MKSVPGHTLVEKPSFWQLLADIKYAAGPGIVSLGRFFLVTVPTFTAASLSDMRAPWHRSNNWRLWGSVNLGFCSILYVWGFPYLLWVNRSGEYPG